MTRRGRSRGSQDRSFGIGSSSGRSYHQPRAAIASVRGAASGARFRGSSRRHEGATAREADFLVEILSSRSPRSRTSAARLGRHLSQAERELLERLVSSGVRAPRPPSASGLEVLADRARACRTTKLPTTGSGRALRDDLEVWPLRSGVLSGTSRRRPGGDAAVADVRVHVVGEVTHSEPRGGGGCRPRREHVPCRGHVDLTPRGILGLPPADLDELLSTPAPGRSAGGRRRLPLLPVRAMRIATWCIPRCDLHSIGRLFGRQRRWQRWLGWRAGSRCSP